MIGDRFGDISQNQPNKYSKLTYFQKSAGAFRTNFNWGEFEGKFGGEFKVGVISR